MPSRLPKHLHDALRAAQLAMQFTQGIDDAAAYAGNVLVRSRNVSMTLRHLAS